MLKYFIVNTISSLNFLCVARNLPEVLWLKLYHAIKDSKDLGRYVYWWYGWYGMCKTKAQVIFFLQNASVVPNKMVEQVARSTVRPEIGDIRESSEN